MIVTCTNFDDVLEAISQSKTKSLDTETTGLYPYHGDRLFSIIIADAQKEYYFNWNDYPKLPGELKLTRGHLEHMQVLFNDPSSTWFMHNAKYDRAMLAQDGLFILGKSHCTKTQARVEYNERKGYRLEDLGELVGFPKDMTVENYIKKHNLYTRVDINGTSVRKPRYDLVPFDLIVPYGERDARATFALGNWQVDQLTKKQMLMPEGIKGPINVMANESQLDDVLFEMERTGLHINRDYCQNAMDFFQGEMESVADEFQKLTGHEFKLSAKVFEKVFADEKDSWNFTATGQMAIGEDDLKALKHPAAKQVMRYKKAQAEINFYRNFLHFADVDGNVHTTYNSGGTRTGGRLSSSNPNLQNLKKDKTEEDKAALYRVRRAVIPRPDYFLVMIDADQIEYRMMVDYANCIALTHKIVFEGLDVHSAAAQLADVNRDDAKTVNFLTLYGGGVPLLAMNLYDTKGTENQVKVIFYKMMGWDKIINKDKDLRKAHASITPALRKHNIPLLEKAKGIQDAIFGAAPEIKGFIKGVQERAQKRGFIFNWCGRMSYFPQKRLSYKAPNTLIQGGAGDVLKFGMVAVAKKVLHNTKSRLLMNVHDELVFEIHKDEESVIPKIVETLESVYPNKHVPLTFGVEASRKSLADKEEWTGIGWFDGKETRNQIQRGQGTPVSRESSEELV